MSVGARFSFISEKIGKETDLFLLFFVSTSSSRRITRRRELFRDYIAWYVVEEDPSSFQFMEKEKRGSRGDPWRRCSPDMNKTKGRGGKQSIPDLT